MTDKCSFDAILNHPVGLKKFTAYCEKDYSSENIHFYCASRLFDDPQCPLGLNQKLVLLQRLYEEYISDLAPRQVGVTLQR